MSGLARYYPIANLLKPFAFKRKLTTFSGLSGKNLCSMQNLIPLPGFALKKIIACSMSSSLLDDAVLAAFKCFTRFLFLSYCGPQGSPKIAVDFFF